MTDIVALQDTYHVPPISKFEIRPMPADWDATHPLWEQVEWPAWLRC